MDSDNDQHLRRYDGKLAFSASGRSFADLRQATAGSRIKKVLGKGGPFSEEFKAAILNDHEHVLERDYLLTELEAYKKVLVALEAAPQDPDAAKLLRRLRADPVTRKSSSTLCPIWRHENQTYNALTVTSRYAFPRVADELYLLTIVFDFAENIFQLEAKIREAHLRLNELVKRMTALRAGVMMVGCFEPDLFDGDELSSKESLRRMLADFSLRPGPSGGWVVTGHFFVRVPNKEAFEALLREIFPSRRWDRVRFDKIKKKKKLVATLMLILGYGAKYPRALFNVSLRGKKRKKADKRAKKLEACFVGPSYNRPHSDPSFDTLAAIRQWALLIERLGESKVYYSVESLYAQKWYSDSEMDFLIKSLDHFGWVKNILVEIHRDCGPYNDRYVLDRLKGNQRHLRTRRLRYDEEWISETDCSDLDPRLELHDFEKWLFKK